MPKKPSHATVVAYVALLFAMTGTAVAATGGTFLLGRSNSESSVATLRNTTAGEPALDLRTANDAVRPFGVGTNRTRVPNLNADLLDGLHASALALRVYRTSTSFTVPPGVSRMVVEVRGAGGGGGAAGGGGNGAAGGQGGWSRVLVTVTPGHVYDITIGAGGAAGTSGGNGGPGGATYVQPHGSSLDTARATGGSGGMHGESCDWVAGNGAVPGGNGGSNRAPTDTASLVLGWANGLDGAGSTFFPPPCPSTPIGGTGTPRFAGGGGSGGAGATSGDGVRGRPGLVMLSFLP